MILDPDLRMMILFNKMKSSFPKKDMIGKMHSFQTSWYKEFPFIEYSKNNDAVYCFCYAIFQESMKMLLKVDSIIGIKLSQN